MDVVVLIKQVPDPVEELEIDASGKSLDRNRLSYVLNEWDAQALEQALLLKERHGGGVTVLSLDLGEPEEALFTAIAGGADRAIKLSGPFLEGVNNHAAAGAFKTIVSELPHTLILTGVQASDDLDGGLGLLLAHSMGLPYVGAVRKVEADTGGGTATVEKEYPGGLAAGIEVALPAVLGVQSAESPPRYVPFGRIRRAMRSAQIEERSVEISSGSAGFKIRRMSKPEPTGRAEMIEGAPEQIATKLKGIVEERGLR